MLSLIFFKTSGSVLELIEIVRSGVCLDEVDCISIERTEVRESVETYRFALAVACNNREFDVEERSIVLESREVG